MTSPIGQIPNEPGAIADAIEGGLAREAWQLAEIQAGIACAERGDFATAAEVASVRSKYLNLARKRLRLPRLNKPSSRRP